MEEPRRRGVHELRFVQCFVLQGGDTAAFGLLYEESKDDLGSKRNFLCLQNIPKHVVAALHCFETAEVHLMLQSVVIH